MTEEFTPEIPPIADELLCTLNTRAWKLIEKDVRDRKEHETLKLVFGCQGEPDTLPSQDVRRGWVQALTWVLDELVPGLVMDSPAIQKKLDSKTTERREDDPTADDNAEGDS